MRLLLLLLLLLYVQPAAPPSSLCGSTLNLRHKLFNQILLVLSLHIDTIDVYQFISLLVTFTLVGGLKVSGKQNLFASYLKHLSTVQTEIWRGDKAVQVEYLETTFD